MVLLTFYQTETESALSSGGCHKKSIVQVVVEVVVQAVVNLL